MKKTRSIRAHRDRLTELEAALAGDTSGVEAASQWTDLAWETPLFIHLHGEVLGALLAGQRAAGDEAMVGEVADRWAARYALCDLQRQAPDEALARCEARLAESCVARPELLQAVRCRALVMLGRGDALDAVDLPTLLAWEDREAAVQMGLAQTEVATAAGDVAQIGAAMAVVDEVLRGCGHGLDDVRHYAQFMRAFVAQTQDKHGQAADLHREAMSLAKAWDATHEDLQSRYPLGNLLAGIGAREEGITLFEQGVEIARRGDNLGQLSIFLEGLARLHNLGGEWERGLRWAVEAQTLGLDKEHWPLYASASTLRVMSLGELERNKDAYRETVLAASRLEATGNVKLAGLLWEVRDTIREELGDERFTQLSKEVYAEEVAKANQGQEP